MDSWGTLIFTGCSCEDSNPEPPKASYSREKKKWGEISDLKFH